MQTNAVIYLASVLAVVPLAAFCTLSGPAKLLGATAFLTAPVFFGGLIFIRSFARCGDKPAALGSNLLAILRPPQLRPASP